MPFRDSEKPVDSLVLASAGGVDGRGQNAPVESPEALGGMSMRGAGAAGSFQRRGDVAPSERPLCAIVFVLFAFSRSFTHRQTNVLPVPQAITSCPRAAV